MAHNQQRTLNPEHLFVFVAHRRGVVKVVWCDVESEHLVHAHKIWRLL